VDVIKPARIQEFCEQYPGAESRLMAWLRIAKTAKWKNFVELRADFPHADQVRVKSGRSVMVFNISGNRYRLICAVHFNTQRVFVMKFLTHAQYSRDTWKDDL
jgi:mRNA interferase HigB